MKTKKKKETTIDDLSKKIDVLAVSMGKGFKTIDNRFKAVDEKMEAGFKRSDERLKTAINGLALMIGKGFNEMGERINVVDEKIESLEKRNTREHEEMKLRQDEVPYRFEFVELEKRVEVLERKAV